MLAADRIMWSVNGVDLDARTRGRNPPGGTPWQAIARRVRLHDRSHMLRLQSQLEALVRRPVRSPGGLNLA